MQRNNFRSVIKNKSDYTQKSDNIYNHNFEEELENKCFECREHFFKLLAEFSDDWVYWINPDSSLGYNSPSCKYITGYDSSDKIFHSNDFFRKILHPHSIDKLKKHDEQLYQGVSFCCDEFMIIRKSGEPRWIYHYCQAVYDSLGKYLGRYVSNKDITEIKMTGNFISSNDENLPQVYEDTLTGYYQLYFDGKLKSANKPFLKMLGYESEDFLLKINFEEFCVLDLEKRNKLKRTLLRNGRVADHESEWITKNSSIVYLRETVSIVKSETDYRPYYQGIVENITEEKLTALTSNEMFDNKKESEKLKTQFLATISHEVRTPLNVILNFIGMLKNESGLSSTNDKNEIIGVVEEEGKRIQRTIDLILEMAQLQTGTFEYNFIEIDLVEMIDRISKAYRSKIEEKEIQFDVTNKLTETKIYADEHSLFQIFNQLLDNAIKFTERGKIEIVLSENNCNQLSVEISDSGLGISEEYIPHLFESFSQEDNSYSRTFEGTGLGLAVVKKHCELNKITIEVESKKQIGSRFKLTFDREMIF